MLLSGSDLIGPTPPGDRQFHEPQYADPMAQAHANGITIEYEVRGHGEPLLLVMGLGGQLISWPEGWVDGLVARGFQVITFDNRDIGLSTKSATPPPTLRQTIVGGLLPRTIKTGYRLADMADDAAGLLDALGIASAHVVGMSMGGMIAQELAIRHPSKVRSLTSIMSTTGNRRVGRVSLRLLRKLNRLLHAPADQRLEAGVETFRLISGSHFDEADARRSILEGVARSGDDREGTARQTAAIGASPDRTPGLRQLTMPALVIHGLEDPLVMPSGGIATAKAIPGARLLMFPDMGHNLPNHRWPEVFDAIVANTKRATATAMAESSAHV